MNEIRSELEIETRCGKKIPKHEADTGFIKQVPKHEADTGLISLFFVALVIV